MFWGQAMQQRHIDFLCQVLRALEATRQAV